MNQWLRLFLQLMAGLWVGLTVWRIGHQDWAMAGLNAGFATAHLLWCVEDFVRGVDR